MTSRRTAVKGRARVGAWGTAVLITVALGATLLGGGRIGHAVESFDGSAWLWSRGPGEVARVNPDNGKVERRRGVSDARGHRVKVTQNDQHLLIHDLDTGRVSSLDLSGLKMSGRLDVGTRGDPHLVMGAGAAALVEPASGAVRALDPATLRPAGPVLRLPGPLVGGQFDSAGRLWVAVPSQGTVTALKVSAQGAAVVRTAEVAEPGHELALSALDDGALVVDRGGRDLVIATGEGTRRVTAPVPLAGAMVPDRIHGRLAAITVPAAGAVVTLDDAREGGPVRSFPLREPVQEPTVPFAGKVYVPVRETGQVRVYDTGGRQTGALSMPTGRGDLELKVREGNLFVNAPGSAYAQVVDAGGRARMVGKYPGGPGTGKGDGDRPDGRRPGNGPPRVEVPPVDPRFPDPVVPRLPKLPDLRPPQHREKPSTPPSPPKTERPSTTRPDSKPTTRTRAPKPPARQPSHKPTPPTRKPKPPTRKPEPPTKKPKPPTKKPKPPQKPKPKPNPYTPQQVCNSGGGSGYVVQRSSSFSGGRVYQLYSSSTKKNCAVTMKTANVGKATSVWVRLKEKTGGESVSDSGTFKYYAGPVYVNAPGVCVRYSGGASGASASAGWGNCG